MIAATKYRFNSSPFKKGIAFPQPTKDDYPTKVIKNGPIELVYKHTTNYIRNVLDAVPIESDRRILVDIKVHDLKYGQIPCIPGWHCDGGLEPWTFENQYHIFVTGFNARTQFINVPMELEVKTGMNLLSLQDQIEELNPSFVSIPSAQIVSYNHDNFHRGAWATNNHLRLLVRVCETSILKPNTKWESIPNTSYANGPME